MRALLVSALPVLLTSVAAQAQQPHNVQYYMQHPVARAAMETRCWPGLTKTKEEIECRNAWQAGKSVIGQIFGMPPEEVDSNPASWRVQGHDLTLSFVKHCGAPSSDPSAVDPSNPECKAAREALAGPWTPSDRHK